jgi:hypothetical protein
MKDGVFLLTLCACALMTTSAFASKNDGGSIIVHTHDAYTWSTQSVCSPGAGTLPESCELANTTSTDGEDAVLWLLAAFHEDTGPAVTVIYFGIEYDNVHLDPGVNLRMCGPAGSLEVPDDDWPYGGGNAVAFGSPVTDRLFPFYALRVAGGAAGSYFATAINPTGGYAAFVDDGNPPGMDRITRFGTVRWFESGDAECPVPPRLGACCAEEGCIQILNESDCYGLQGNWLGVGVDCGVNPCGACCYWEPEGGYAYTRQCVFISELDCYENSRWSVLQVVQGALIGPAWAGSGIHCASYDGEADSLWHCQDPRVNPPNGWHITCCLPNGTCTQLIGIECWGQGGTSVGWMCPPEPCYLDWRGACCIGPECRQLDHTECTIAGGGFQGYETTCDPNPCPPTAVERTTWGRIRNSYR